MSSPTKRAHTPAVATLPTAPDQPLTTTSLNWAIDDVLVLRDVGAAVALDVASSFATATLAAAALDFASKQAEDIVWNGTEPVEDDVNIQETLLYAAVNNVAISSRIYIALRLADIASQYFPPLSLGIQDLQGAALPVSLVVWAALSASTAKRTLFLQLVSGESLGRAILYDKLLDFVIFLFGAMEVLGCLGVDFDGTGIPAMLSAGGVGALAISLASRSLLEQIVGGVSLQAYNGFEEGDLIMLGDGTEGFVRKIGLVETQIAGYDNIVIRVPNGQFVNQRVSNLSRMDRCRVKQTLRFKYSDLKKLKGALESIKLEIYGACPKLITDGSKPFYAVLDSYEEDHLLGVVVCHFDGIPPRGPEYVNNRQEVLFAIARALEKNDVGFALPSIVYRTANEGQFNALEGEANSVGRGLPL